ncbi:PEP-utilizing enzyme [Paenibacillus sp. 1P07SE]|uniref:PEP-utilizing enzyme n=1 Tax=Paenibacillus sp. 1P07SE TaxID=3132209 RepID=UPI0039A64705
MLIETIHQTEIGGWMYQRAVPLGGREGQLPPDSIFRPRVENCALAIREDKAGIILQTWRLEWKADMIRRGRELGAVELKSMDDAHLVAHLAETKTFLHDCLRKHMLINNAVQLMLAEHAFLCRDALGWEEQELMSLFGGLSAMSSEPAIAIAELGRHARTRPTFMKALEAGASLSELLDMDETFSRMFQKYQEEYGCRALRCELSFPTIAEMPELLFGLLRDQLFGGYQPDREERELEQKRREQEAKARAGLRGQTLDIFIRTLVRARDAYPVREEHGFYDRDLPLALLRYAYLEAGRRMVNRDQLADVPAVFHLEWEEVRAGLQHREPLFNLVQQRETEHKEALDHPGPDHYGSPSPPSTLPDGLPEEVYFQIRAQQWTMEHAMIAPMRRSGEQDAHQLQGLAASGGVYRGTVRIVRNESEFHRIRRGDVLVCPIASPVWSILFPSIGALVTEFGGILSHAAIIAREYQLPAVVAVDHAITTLKDGQLVEVDGERGTVKRILVGGD